MPGKKVTKRASVLAREKSESRNKNIEHVEPPKLVLEAGAGWTLDNLNYLRSVPPENLIDELYNMFGIPISFKNDASKSPVHVFIEFHRNSFVFSNQYSDPTKCINIIAILSDYIGYLHTFSTSKDAFSLWYDKATSQIQALDFTPNETAVFNQYITQSIKTNSHVLHFVLNQGMLKNADQEVARLFRPVRVETADNGEEDAAAREAAENELEAQQQILAQAMKEKKENEERQQQKELAAAIEEMVSTSYSRIQTAIDSMNDHLLSVITAFEEKLDGPAKGRK